jgi:hypothetical protein
MIKNKIVWRKPDYKNEYGRVSDTEIERMCRDRTGSTGDIKIERNQYGRKITYVVYRVEKIGELIEGLETLSRQQAIEELKKLEFKKMKGGNKQNDR